MVKKDNGLRKSSELKNLKEKEQENKKKVIEKSVITAGDIVKPTFLKDGEYVKLNPKSFVSLQKALVNNKKALVIQATGTGKSFLLSEHILENYWGTGKNILVLTSTDSAKKQFEGSWKIALKEHEKYTNIKQGCNIYTALYASLTDKLLEKLSPNMFDCIYLDETHHIGADSGERI